MEQIRTHSARRKIIESAIDLFAKEGVSSTSVAMITQQAQVSKSLFFYYFANKEALVDGVVEAMVKDQCQPFTELLRRTKIPSGKQCVLFADLYFRAFRRYHRYILPEDIGTRIRWQFRRALEPQIDHLAQQLVAQGLMRQPHADQRLRVCLDGLSVQAQMHSLTANIIIDLLALTLGIEKGQLDPYCNEIHYMTERRKYERYAQ